MSWEYRVFRGQIGDETYHVIREAYYGPKGRDGEIGVGCASAPEGETVEELRAELMLMLGALEHPVIDEASRA